MVISSNYLHMSKFYSSTFTVRFTLIFMLLSAFQMGWTQTTVVINTGTAGTPAYNAGPIYRSSASSSYDFSHYAYLYTQAELATAGIVPGSLIYSVGWVKDNNATTNGPATFRIFMKNSAATEFSAATETWANLNSGATMVYENLAQTIPATQSPNYITFTFATPFTYTGGSLEVSTEWDVSAVTGSATTAAFDWMWSTVNNSIYGVGSFDASDIGTLSSTSNSISDIEDRRPFIQFTFTSSPCVTPPTPGTAVSSKLVICTGESFTLSLTGNSSGSGQTYQWQSSPDNTTWTDITGAVSPSYSTTQPGTTYYRALVTCSGNSQPSSSVQVVTTAPVSGTYTIGAGGNFATFNDAYNFIRCGINGPVIFNVLAGSGPYNEQLIMDEVPGASAANTITFNGNGNTISYLSTTSGERAVIKLNGADYVTFDNLVVTATGTTTTEYGFGFHLINNADFNTISNCTININTSSTSTNYAGIAVSNSPTSATGTGDTQSDDNTFANNTITGGYYGITLVGSSTLANQRNKILNNNVLDFYIYGIYVYGSFDTRIDSNLISRPARATVSTFYGIYVTNLSARLNITRNTITNPFGGNTSSTSTFNGIYFTSSDALFDFENVVSNNKIYNINGGADINGFYNSGSDNVWYFHNTILIDGTATDASDLVRGFYQTTAASGIEFKNNIVHISRGGPADKYALYFNNATSDIISDTNDLYLSAIGGNNFVGYLGGDHILLANWQTASGQDMHSVSNDPVYEDLAAGNLKPTNSTINNLGSPMPEVPIDILGMPRDPATPDMGAYEFAPVGCVVPPTPGTAIVSNTPVCENSMVALSVTGNSTGLGQTYQWQASSAIGGPYAPISGVLTNPSFTVTATESLYYRLAVTCGGNTQYSTPVLLEVTPALPGGTYTIDATSPASPTNFISFNAAKAAMACGISGPVVFDVEPNSGPYLEQLILDSIPGTSSTNTITFNGNGNTIQFSSTETSERAVIKLNSTDYVTFDSLIIDATGTGNYGFGVHLINNADSNTFSRNLIITDSTSTSTSYAGVAISASATSATGTGAGSRSDGNLFERNTIVGGYYGVTVIGGSADIINNNRFIGNNIKEFYSYGMYVSYTNGTFIEGNSISRPNRTNTSTFYGIYVNDPTTSAVISKNRLFQPKQNDLTSTSSMYGIYFTSADGVAGQENRVVNNAIYEFNGPGTIYALYNSSSSYVHYYHNSVILDESSLTGTSAITRGFYQITTAEGIEFKNNLISITRGGSDDKHAIYFGTAANSATIASDRNNFYVNGTPSSDNFVGYHSGNRVTLADWQTSTSDDANSQSVDPLFLVPVGPQFIPFQALIDNIGEPVGVTTDILGNPRSGATPDPGAWEFAVTPCVAPPTPGTTVVTPGSGICLGTTVLLNLSGNSTGGFQKYVWQTSSSGAGPWTDITDTLYAPEHNYTLSSYTNIWFRAAVVCGPVAEYSMPFQVVLNPAMIAGDYTIDPGSPVSPTNFQSFASAVTALECGITGSVRFHIVPGTYNEQVRITDVPGVSATSTITFMSQNGDPASVILSYDATSSAANYVLKLDSALYTTFKNITITALNADNTRAVEIANNASNDSLLNNIINVPSSSSTSTAYAAVYGTSLTGSNIVVKNNTITNGMSGIYLTGTTRISNGFVIDSNTISGTYYYGIYASALNYASISGNTISRSGVINATSYGLYATNCDSAYRVNGNTVNIADAGTTVYGIYLTGCQASTEEPGQVIGNKVMASGTNTGNQYGMYLTSTTRGRILNNVLSVNTSGATSYGMYVTGIGGMEILNNSVQNASTSATNNIAAYISQSSGSNGFSQIMNNIFTHMTDGRAANIVNPRFINIDYNLYYTAGPTLIQWGTANLYATLQQWRDTSYQDFNSIVYRPAFTGTALQPDLASPDVWAIHGRGVQVENNDRDINGDARPTTLVAGVPDLGAYEFLPTSIPVLLTVTPATPAPGITQTFMLGTDTVTKVTWGANAPASIEGRRYTGISPVGLTSAQQHMYFYTDFDITGTDPTGHTVQQYYLDPWRGLIPNESMIKMGRTQSGTTWTISTTSVIDSLANTINEADLQVMDKYTGLTDGQALPRPPIVVDPSDSSNMGKKFWVGYGHHQDFGSGNAQEMVLYLGAGVTPATVTVRINGTSWAKTYNVPANSVISSDFIPKFGAFDARLTDEGLSTRGISIESNAPITAYAHIYGNTNSGATMLLPVGTYGYEYYALTSKQNYASNTYSWVNVVAAYDSTVVEIIPSKPTLNGRPAGVPFTIQLRKGEVYQVLGAIISGSDGYDLTGTKVKSIANASGKCYPIAVFSGSSRTNIGCDNANPTGSGDNIIQQNFPYKAWGRRYLTAVTSSSLGADRLHTNIFKVVVKDPTTVVTRNGVVLSNLIDNLYYQFNSDSSDYILADKPIMVAQFVPSQSSASGCTQNAGVRDPEMIYLSPIEQGIKSVALYRNTEYNITTQYLTLIIPTAGLSTLMVDASNTFDYTYPHQGLNGYTVVVKRWAASNGQSIVTSDSAFTAITYGFGSAESYGYNAGTLVKNLNVYPSYLNVLSTGTGSSTYTCENAPFQVSFLSTIQPTNIEWMFSQVPGLSPNADLTQNNPTPVSTEVINGITYYKYTVNQDFTFTGTGIFAIPIFITHPDIEGCNNRMETSLTIDVRPAPVPDFTLPSVVCVGSTVQFNGVVGQNITPAATWTWDFDNGTTATGQNATQAFTPAGSYDIKLDVVTVDGCIGTVTKPLNITEGPAVSFAPDSVNACLNSNVTFTVQNPVANAVYTWYDAAAGGNVVHTGTSYTITNVTAPMSLYVGSTLNGCAGNGRTRIQVTVQPQLSAPVVVADSIGANAIRFTWNAVPGATGYEISTNAGTSWSQPSSGPNGLTHTISGLTVGQTVTLSVRATGGCQPSTGQATAQTLTDEVFIPNSFTPNGDGLNDVLRVYGNSIREMRFMIFNQWGEKIFESRSQSASWNGQYGQKVQPSGVYMYVCDIVLTDGRKLQRKGSVNLIR